MRNVVVLLVVVGYVIYVVRKNSKGTCICNGGNLDEGGVKVVPLGAMD